MAQQTEFDAAKAASWDANPLFQQLSTAAADALASGGLLPARAVLELGCGTGMLAEKIADSSVEAYVGVDTSPDMIAAFQRKIAARGDSRLLCLLGELPGALDAAAGTSIGPQLPKQFDLAVSHLTMHHIQDIPGTLRTLQQLLKPGGRIAVFDVLKEPGSHRFNKPGSASVHHVGGFSFEEMEGYMAGAGFVEAACRVVTPFQKASWEEPQQLLPFHLSMCWATKPTKPTA